MARTGRCTCGGLEVTCDGDPIRISMCHCYACQQRTGSVFGVQARYPADKVTARGDEKTYVRIGDDGGKITFHFCPTCGATVYWDIDLMPGFVAVAVGAFADREFGPPTFSVYEARRHAWTKDPDLQMETWD
ncbi:MAG: GFA family protein [Myxococcales bacterium]|nr:GFA family protein [Myxococcales bacterium]